MASIDLILFLDCYRRLSLYQSGPSSPPVNPVEQIDPRPGTSRDYSMEIGMNANTSNRNLKLNFILLFFTFFRFGI